MKKEDLKEYTTKELIEMVKNEKLKLVKLRINHKISPLENPMIIRNTKRKIARILTELRRRELEKNKKNSNN